MYSTPNQTAPVDSALDLTRAEEEVKGQFYEAKKMQRGGAGDDPMGRVCESVCK